MGIKTVLFDLDGTLLPMNQEQFTECYFKLLATKMAAYGYEPGQLVDTIWAGTKAMITNDGTRKNEEVFWEKFAKTYGEKSLADKALFDEFYRIDFQDAKVSCGYNPEAAKAVAQVKEMGYRTVLATNPIFPVEAIKSRVHWAGLDLGDFEFYTTYENIGYCKPNPCYYSEILRQIGTSPDECCMVGNDVSEDMIAETTGMHVFLLTNCLINKEQKDISAYPHGDFSQLLEFIKILTSCTKNW